MSIDFFKTGGFKTSNLTMIPCESYMLVEAMKRYYPKECIDDVDPHNFLSSDVSQRITPHETKEYGVGLKQHLENLRLYTKIRPNPCWINIV